MSDPKNDDEAKFNETLKRMLDTKPKPHKPPQPTKGEDKRQRSGAMHVEQSARDKK